MAIIRVEKCHDYTIMSNYHLRDTRMSLKAVGLLSKILGLPDSWVYTVDGLVRICKEGKDAVTAALKELEECGYLHREQTRDKGGGFGPMTYVIREIPLGVDAQTQDVGEWDGNAPLPENPLTENPPTGKPLTENPPQSNTKYINNLDINPPIVPPKGGRRGRKQKLFPDWMPERFEGFWACYPLKKDKQGAIRAWDKLKPTSETVDVMARELVKQKASEDWQRGIGIPYPKTWLNNCRWEDEQTAPSKTEGTGQTEPEGAYRL